MCLPADKSASLDSLVQKALIMFAIEDQPCLLMDSDMIKNYRGGKSSITKTTTKRKRQVKGAGLATQSDSSNNETQSPPSAPSTSTANPESGARSHEPPQATQSTPSAPSAQTMHPESSQPAPTQTPQVPACSSVIQPVASGNNSKRNRDSFEEESDIETASTTEASSSTRPAKLPRTDGTQAIVRDGASQDGASQPTKSPEEWIASLDPSALRGLQLLLANPGVLKNLPPADS